MGRPERYGATADLFKALTAPVRVAIVVELMERPRRVYELVDILDAPQPLISQHLRILRGAGLVRGERHGREVAYALVDFHVARIVTDAVQHASERHA